jgi:hypothetical protein
MDTSYGHKEQTNNIHETCHKCYHIWMIYDLFLNITEYVGSSEDYDTGTRGQK